MRHPTHRSVQATGRRVDTSTGIPTNRVVNACQSSKSGRAPICSLVMFPMQGRLMRGMLLAGAGVMALCGMESAPRAQSTEQQPLQRQIDELRRLLNQQQRMIIQQQQTIGQQQQTIGDLQIRVGSLQGQQADIQQQAQETRQRVVDKPLIASSNPRMRVTLSGQVDRLSTSRMMARTPRPIRGQQAPP